MRLLLLRASVAALVVLAVFACSTENGAKGAASSSSGSPDGPDSSVANDPDGSGSSTSSSSSSSSSGGDGAPPSTANVTLTNETMVEGGVTHAYILAKPTNYDANKKYPLVLSFHGNPGTATGMAQGLPFDSVSKREAIIAYPQAQDDNSWDLYTPTDENADMNFIAGLPDEIATKVNIDKTKIFGFGFSGGGFFLPQFTCRFGGIFKAISVNAGGGPDEPQMGFDKYDNGCYKCPGGPIAAIITHGANDTEVQPSSGEFTHACYATFNGCSDTLSATTPSPCQLHDGCPADKPVKWCLIPGLPHAVWSEAMTQAWAFFTGLP